RRSLLTQLALCAVAVTVFVPAVVMGYTGPPERHEAVVVSIPIALFLLALYLIVTFRNLRRHRAARPAAPAAGAWTLPMSLVVLGVATVVTAIISEILV